MPYFSDWVHTPRFKLKVNSSQSATMDINVDSSSHPRRQFTLSLNDVALKRLQRDVNHAVEKLDRKAREFESVEGEAGRATRTRRGQACGMQSRGQVKWVRS